MENGYTTLYEHFMISAYAVATRSFRSVLYVFCTIGGVAFYVFGERSDPSYELKNALVGIIHHEIKMNKA